MTATAKRIFLLTMLAVAGVLVVLCISLAALGGSEGVDVAMELGSLNGMCLLLIFAALTAMDRALWRATAVVGMVLSSAAMLFFTLYMLVNLFNGTLYGRTSNTEDLLSTLMFTAALFCLGSWIGALRMKTAGRVAQLCSLLSMLCLYVGMVYAIWTHGGGGVLDQSMPVIGLICGASTLAVFVLYKFFGLKLPDPLTTIDQKLFVRCPRCLKEQELPMGESHCASCNLRFTIDMEEPKCPKCGYNLRGLTHAQCPECGRAIAAGDGAAAEFA